MIKPIKYIKGKLIILLAAISALALCACGGSAEPERTTLVLNSDGTLEHTIISENTQGIPESDLKEYIEEEIDAFKEENPDSKIRLEKCSADDTGIVIKMTYESTADYTAFNGVECFSGKVKEASGSGYSFLTDFVSGNGQVIRGYTLPVQYADSNILIVEEAMDVVVPGDALAVSGSAVITGSSTASVVSNTDPTLPEVFQTTNLTKTYIIYK